MLGQGKVWIPEFVTPVPEVMDSVAIPWYTMIITYWEQSVVFLSVCSVVSFCTPSLTHILDA